MDYYGWDIPNYSFAARTPQQCQAACFLHPDCNAWTLFMDNGATSMWFLKTVTAETPRTPKNVAVSGRKENCGMSHKLIPLSCLPIVFMGSNCKIICIHLSASTGTAIKHNNVRYYRYEGHAWHTCLIFVEHCLKQDTILTRSAGFSIGVRLRLPRLRPWC